MDFITEINNIYNEDVMNEDWKSKLATGLAIGATALGGLGKQTAQAAPKPAITQSSYSFWSDTPSMIERHEGRKNKVYKDSLGIPTIGIGYNLRNATAKQDLAKVGANLKEVLRGKQLSEDQVNELFRMSLDRALKDAKSYYPEFDKLPDAAKGVLVDMSFNLGLTKLKGFKDLKSALGKGNYNAAADAMIDSAWYRQVKTRGVRLVNIMRGLAR
jgi:lysozyme